MKARNDPRFGEWTPVKLTRRQRLQVYRYLASGKPTGDFAGVIPFPQLERIFKEFYPCEPQPKEAPKLKGIRGDHFYCEAGCGAIIKTKVPGTVFRAMPRDRGQIYVCDKCMALAKCSVAAAEDGRSPAIT